MLLQPALPAKFTHETGLGLRMQTFVLVRDAERRVAFLRLAENPDAWALPGELMRLNEDPAEAAKRVVAGWLKSPVEPRLANVFNYPATGPEDNRWYVLFVYEADAPAGGLEATPDTLEVKFVAPGNSPGPIGYAHGDVWAKVK